MLFKRGNAYVSFTPVPKSWSIQPPNTLYEFFKHCFRWWYRLKISTLFIYLMHFPKMLRKNSFLTNAKVFENHLHISGKPFLYKQHCKRKNFIEIAFVVRVGAST